MADTLRDYPHSRYVPKTMPTTTSGDDLSPRKTLLVIVVVVGCFAVLWPKLFYPMLVANANQHIKPSPIDKTTGCCDVISETDVNTIKIMSELCSAITLEGADGNLPSASEVVTKCRKAVLETCGIDISAALQEHVDLDQSLRQILEEVRSLNGSLCLKYHFGVAPWRLGVPHRISAKSDVTDSIRQERSLHLRSEMVHPAFRERGRAIPKPEAVRRSAKPPRIVEGRPGPIPGLRPTMGGAGHVVPSKQQSAGLMGLLMPVYTIGIVIFFTYTVMKLTFKKKPETYVGVPLYPNTDPDEHFRKEVFESVRDRSNNRFNRDTTNNKLVVNAMSALLDEVDQEIQARRKCAEAIPEQDEIPTKTDDQPSVKVLGMEMTASCEDGKKWSRPVTPVHPVAALQPSEPLPPPQEIFLEGALPAQSQLLVTDSATETQKSSEEDPAVVLAGKMTLSVIACENGTEEPVSGNIETGSLEEDKGTISSNGSDSFEKVEAEQLEEHIGDIIQEALNAASQYEPQENDNDKIEDVRKEEEFNLIEEIEKMNQEIKDGIEREIPVGLEMDKIVIEEVKKQLKLEDDLLEALISDERKDVDTKTIEEHEKIEKEETEAASEDVEHSGAEDCQEEPLKKAQEDKNDHQEADLQISEQHEVIEDTPNTVTEEDLQSVESNTETSAENEEQQAVLDENSDDEAIDEGDYEDEAVDDEIRNVDGTEMHDRLSTEKMNGDDSKHERDGVAVGEEDSVSEGEEGSESDEIEEIIEYVDYTDEEGEEIVEVNERVNENSH